MWGKLGGRIVSGCMWHLNDYIGYGVGSGYVAGVVYMVAYILGMVAWLGESVLGIDNCVGGILGIVICLW